MTGCVIEIIFWRKGHAGIIVLSQIVLSAGTSDGVILSGNMIGHEVDNHFQLGLMRALDQQLKFRHTVVNVYSDIRIDIVVVGDGIRTACLSLDDSGMIGRDRKS